MDFETERLKVRPYTINDQKSISSLLANSKVMKFSFKGPINEEEARKYIKQFFVEPLSRERGFHPIVLKSTEVIIGFAGLIDQKIEGKIWPELGYRLDPSYWGMGYAKEACLAICKQSQHELGLKTLIAIISPENQPSINLAKSLGFKFGFSKTYDQQHVDVYIKEL